MTKTRHPLIIFALITLFVMILFLSNNILTRVIHLEQQDRAIAIYEQLPAGYEEACVNTVIMEDYELVFPPKDDCRERCSSTIRCETTPGPSANCYYLIADQDCYDACEAEKPGRPRLEFTNKTVCSEYILKKTVGIGSDE